ncbi:hypothetical protein D3C87_2065230 [compost metagenome]
MPASNEPPLASDAVIVYGVPPLTAALALEPLLAKLTLPMVSPFCSPLAVKAVPARGRASP